jgi:hypothetical protein
VTACPCQFCSAPLAPAQEFRFLVESDAGADPAYLARIRRLPAAADGKPLRVCDACQRALEHHPLRFRLAAERAAARRQVRAAMLTAAGLLSAGWFLALVLGEPRV